MVGYGDRRAAFAAGFKTVEEGVKSYSCDY